MADSTDRRAADRMPVGMSTACSFAARVVEDFGSAKVKDVSMDGIGLILTRKVDIGSVLVVNLVNEPRGFAKTVFVQVAHVTAVNGGFLVGGSFAGKLTYQELTALVT